MTRHHLLVTNDFPPKVGGIQSYLWELWRRLPPESFTVVTTTHDGAADFDAAAPYRVERVDKVLLPTPEVVRTVNRLAKETGATLAVVDPALPLGLIGPRLDVPYALVLHGAEVTVPGRLPGSAAALRRVLTKAKAIVAAGPYPAAIAAEVAGGVDRLPPTTVVPPGVDTERFRPLDDEERAKARADLGLPDGPLVLGLSRLVPRKGFDVLIRAAARLHRSRPDLTVAIAGGGRDRERLEKLAARTGAPVRFLGRVADDDMPRLYGCADVFAMLCRDRWLGLEQEGFGIVFLEAAACGVAQLAGSSGGASDAVVHRETGVVVADPTSDVQVATELGALLDDDTYRHRLGTAARRRAVEQLSYDGLAADLAAALTAAGA